MKIHFKHNNSSGFAVIEVVLAVVALAAIGAAGYFAYQARQAQLPAKTTQVVAAKPDPYKGWKTFSSSVNGLTFKYPSSWQIKNDSINDRDFKADNLSIISPSGFELKAYNPPNGIGGGCGEPCPIVTTTYSAVKISVPGATPNDAYLVKQRVYSTDEPQNPGEKRIGILQVDPKQDPAFTFDPRQVTYRGFPEYLIFSKRGGDSGTWMTGSYPQTHPNAKLDLEKYFALPDLRDAELVFRSVSYK